MSDKLEKIGAAADEALVALLAISTKLNIGGIDHEIPRMTARKLGFLARDLNDIVEVDEEMEAGKTISEKRLDQSLRSSARAFLILKLPNKKGIKPPTDEEIDDALDEFYIEDIPKISQAIFDSFNYERLVKNSQAPPMTTATAAGAPSPERSPSSSSSPDGNLLI